MSLKFRYFLYLLGLHLALGALAWPLLREQKLLLLAAEAVIILSLIAGYLLFRAFYQPIALMRSGAEAIREGDFSVKYLPTGKAETDELALAYNAMIDRLREERLRIAEQGYLLESLFEASPLGLVVLDFDDQIAAANPPAVRCLELPVGWAGHPFYTIIHPLAHEINQLAQGESKVVALPDYRKYKITLGRVVQQGFFRKFILIEELTAEILRSEKEAYGKVIRLMAHEVNNSLGAVNSILNTLGEYGMQDADTELKESLQLAIRRNTGLTDFVANFAKIIRLGPPNRQPTDLRALLRQCAKIWEARAAECGVRLLSELPEQPVWASLDPLHIEQALHNLIKNALEAIGQNGQVRLSCQAAPLGFCIADDGPGLSAAAAAGLSQPFFSDKAHGQGIGLMLTREIAAGHGARFRLYTDPEDGWTKAEMWGLEGAFR
jgi:two-component system, NtrC family, nitrogen regulation sensor histidine kinase NtrY